MQIVFIFHLSWPGKYFNQPCLPVFPAKLAFCKSFKSTSHSRFSLFHSLHQPRFSFFFSFLHFFSSLFQIFKL